MIVTYVKSQNNLIKKTEKPTLDSSTVWIDLINMTRQEEKLVEKFLGIDIPSKKEMAQLEISNRLYNENNATYIIVTSINPYHNLLLNHYVTFVLYEGKLITVRYDQELRAFNSFVSQLEKPNHKSNEARDLFIELLGLIVEIGADIIQEVKVNIDELNNNILLLDDKAEENSNHIRMLRKLGHQGSIISKAQESILSLTRALNFLSQNDTFNGAEKAKLAIMHTDLTSIGEHAKFLSGEASFLLDAFLGLIQIEQNKIVKLVSIISLVFMPPTLIASIYGMNFDYMPELKSFLGYPITLILMGVCAWLPYKICKKKKWL